VVTAYGVFALTFMMAMYALEHRHRRYVLAFAVGCIDGKGEEVGWRGLAWPSSARHKLAGAAVLLASAWTVWPTRIFRIDSGMPGLPLFMLPGLLLGMTAGAAVLGSRHEQAPISSVRSRPPRPCGIVQTWGSPLSWDAFRVGRELSSRPRRQRPANDHQPRLRPPWSRQLSLGGLLVPPCWA
jgi:hypothetical protein